jgi:hypothetical protein
MQYTVVWSWRSVDLLCERFAPLDELVVAFARAWGVMLE